MGLRAKRQFWIVILEEIHISYNSNVISPKLAPKCVNLFGLAFSNKITHRLKTRDVLPAITSPLFPFSLSLTSIKLVSYIWKRLPGLSLNSYSYKLMWEEAGGWSAVHSSLQIRNWRGTVSIKRSLETYFPSIPSFHLSSFVTAARKFSLWSLGITSKLPHPPYPPPPGRILASATTLQNCPSLLILCSKASNFPFHSE